ncbi:hypothetical protein [Leuconostoc carnosum]|uniref:Uncharacterized protein n=1 Tax=Leuconostoc carnosum (strain JB16) TaxID=1229758 RepID=K0D7M5_LEUCJ|nr:hypothetical protein [Leuconostoc carnosum]AFT81949.1 hypothetical protein C270_05190 [Leuconostoc carnosum JB16]
MMITQQQYDALKVAFDNGILDHDDVAKDTLATVLSQIKTK